MNKIILLLFSVLCLMGRAQGNSEWKMCVVSDVHLMSPELLKSDGKAFQDYLSSDRKLLGESVEIMDSITNRLLAEHPKVLLVTGDLTKDGERVSHQYLVDHSGAADFLCFPRWWLQPSLSTTSCPVRQTTV